VSGTASLSAFVGGTARGAWLGRDVCLSEKRNGQRQTAHDQVPEESSTRLASQRAIVVVSGSSNPANRNRSTDGCSDSVGMFGSVRDCARVCKDGACGPEMTMSQRVTGSSGSTNLSGSLFVTADSSTIVHNLITCIRLYQRSQFSITLLININY